MRRVFLESPFAGNVEQNIAYARASVRDSLLRGEAPFASHLLYTQEGILRDDVHEERRHGFAAAFAWRDVSEATVLYIDLGLSSGMLEGVKDSIAKGIPVEVRQLYAEHTPEYDSVAIGNAKCALRNLGIPIEEENA